MGGRRHGYRGKLRERIGRLANMLAGLGVAAGDTVAMMDWDSHRYLGVLLRGADDGGDPADENVRLTPEQILYTLNHARADVVLVNAEFLAIPRRHRAAPRDGEALRADRGRAPSRRRPVPLAGEV